MQGDLPAGKEGQADEQQTPPARAPKNAFAALMASARDKRSPQKPSSPRKRPGWMFAAGPLSGELMKVAVNPERWGHQIGLLVYTAAALELQQNL